MTELPNDDFAGIFNDFPTTSIGPSDIILVRKASTGQTHGILGQNFITGTTELQSFIWVSTGDYDTGSAVIHNGEWYVSLIDNNQVIPIDDGVNWDLIGKVQATVARPWQPGLYEDSFSMVTVSGVIYRMRSATPGPFNSIVSPDTDLVNWETIGGTGGGGISESDLQNSLFTYNEDSGAVNAYDITMSPAVAAYVEGLRLNFKASSTNTGASTIEVNGLPVTPLIRKNGDPLEAGDIESGSIVTIFYDGVNFQLINAEISGRSQVTDNIIRVDKDYFNDQIVAMSGHLTLTIDDSNPRIGKGTVKTIEGDGNDIIFDSQGSSIEFIHDDNITTEVGMLYTIVCIYLASGHIGVFVNSGGTAPAQVSPPVILFAEVQNIARNVILIQYDKNLDESSVPVPGDFPNITGSLTGANPCTSVNVSGDQVLLTCTTDFDQDDDPIEADYVIGANPIRESTGQQNAAAFTDLVVNNAISFDPSTISLQHFFIPCNVAGTNADPVTALSDTLTTTPYGFQVSGGVVSRAVQNGNECIRLNGSIAIRPIQTNVSSLFASIFSGGIKIKLDNARPSTANRTHLVFFDDNTNDRFRLRVNENGTIQILYSSNNVDKQITTATPLTVIDEGVNDAMPDFQYVGWSIDENGDMTGYLDGAMNAGPLSMAAAPACDMSQFDQQVEPLLFGDLNPANSIEGFIRNVHLCDVVMNVTDHANMASI